MKTNDGLKQHISDVHFLAVVAILVAVAGNIFSGISIVGQAKEIKHLENQIETLQNNDKILQEHIYKIIKPVQYPNTDKGVK